MYFSFVLKIVGKIKPIGILEKAFYSHRGGELCGCVVVL